MQPRERKKERKKDREKDLAVSLDDLLLGGRALDVEDLVVVALLGQLLQLLHLLQALLGAAVLVVQFQRLQQQRARVPGSDSDSEGDVLRTLPTLPTENHNSNNINPASIVLVIILNYNVVL